MTGGEHLVRGMDNPHPEFTRVYPTLSTEDVAMIREMHGWLKEIMPAARVAIKLMDARANLTRRWRGNGSKG